MSENRNGDDAGTTEDLSEILNLTIPDKRCIWDCRETWLSIQPIVFMIILHPSVKIFIVVCIVSNTILLALYHDNMSKDFLYILTYGNQFCTIIFGCDIALKVIAWNPKFYFQNKWNLYDFIVVTVSLLGFVFHRIAFLSVLRFLVLVRLIGVKIGICISWRPLKGIFPIFLIISILAIIGMHAFAGNYANDKPQRLSFSDFLHSFTLVFRTMCGEWLESMRNCTLVNGTPCIPYFLVTTVVTNFVVKNVFLAIIFNSGIDFFYEGLLPSRDNRTIIKACSWCKNNGKPSPNFTLNPLISEYIEMVTKFQEPINTETAKDGRTLQITDGSDSEEKEDEDIDLKKEQITEDNISDKTEEEENRTERQQLSDLRCKMGDDEIDLYHEQMTEDDLTNKTEEEENRTERQQQSDFRCKISRIIKSKYYKIIVATIILASSLALTLEDIYLLDRMFLQHVLYYLDAFLVFLFLGEMVIMWLGLGVKKYFTQGYCFLDFLIVVVLVSNFIFENPVLKAVRILRLLSLVYIVDYKPMMVFIETILPNFRLLFTLLSAMCIWFVFAVIGVHLFAGKYYKCVATNGTPTHLEIMQDRVTCETNNHSWVNSRMNFDHLGKAYLSLLQTATVQGGIEFINDSTIYFFIIFITFGSFFIQGVLIYIIRINYEIQTQMKIKDSNTLYFLTEDQRKLFKVTKHFKEPIKAIPKPKRPLQLLIFEVVTHWKFEIVMSFFIGLNLVMLAMRHPYQSFLDYHYIFFIVIFTFECLIKMIGLRCFYFTQLWNIFDLIIVILTITELVFVAYCQECHIVSPAILRIIRLVKLRQFLSRFKRAKVFNILYFTISSSLSSLFHISLLLFLVMTVYAIFGMSLFKNLGVIDGFYSFETFVQSMILLFPLSTSYGWNKVLTGFENYNQVVLLTYLLSYIFICFIIYTLYTAVVILNYAEIWNDDDYSNADYDMFYAIWQHFDPDATKYIHLEHLPGFLDTLEPPFRVSKPNKYKIIAMEIPIYEGNRVMCWEVLYHLSAYQTAMAYHNDEIFLDDDIKADLRNLTGEPISTTLLIVRQEFAAKLIQKRWRRFKANDGGMTKRPEVL